MRIHGLCIAKNESDVIAQTLRAATAWCDAIYVWDNGSTDGTWETVLELADTYPQIVADRQDGTPFKKALRSHLFEAHRAEAAEGDWWCVLDADEFYIDDPRTFLAGIRPSFDEVWAASFEYYFTEKDVARYADDPAAYADDVAVEQKLRYYANNWSEPRFFRLRRGVVWRKGAWPEGLGPAYPVRIRLKHFQYRSPQQIQKRLETRLEPMRRGHFRHEGLADWKRAMLDVRQVDFGSSSSEHAAGSWTERVIDSSLLIEDTPDRDYVINEKALPPIPRAWAPWFQWLRTRARRLRRSSTRTVGRGDSLPIAVLGGANQPRGKDQA